MSLGHISIFDVPMYGRHVYGIKLHRVHRSRPDSDVPHNTYVNLTDGNLAVFILPRSHARVIVVRRHGSVKSVYPLFPHQQTTCSSTYFGRNQHRFIFRLSICPKYQRNL